MAIVISGVNNNDKITASDGTIDLLSGVNYAGIITAPGFTASNNITAASINVGSNIQIGNAGIITATTLIGDVTGNVTGNVNATSNLLLQIGGSEKFRVGSSGQLGIAGANYGTSGQVLTSGGSGSAATWSTVSGTTINNNANNRLITGSGSANTLNAESNVLYDGTNFGIGKAPSRTLDVQGKIRSSDSVCFGDNSSTPSEGAAIHRPAASTLAFVTNNAERVRITSGGQVCIGTNTATRPLNIKDPAQIYLESTSTGDWSGIQIKGSSGTNNYNAYFGLLDSNGNFFIDNGSNGNDFIIKPTGQIEMPNQPMVRFSGNWTYTSWNSHQQVVMNGEQEDKGGNFSNGIFTVPTGGEGVYVISASFIGPVPGGNFILWQFFKNTTGLNAWVQGYSSGGNEESTSATIAVSCSVGDTLRVAFHNSYQYGYTSGYNAFTIFKVH